MSDSDQNELLEVEVNPAGTSKILFVHLNAKAIKITLRS